MPQLEVLAYLRFWHVPADYYPVHRWVTLGKLNVCTTLDTGVGDHILVLVLGHIVGLVLAISALQGYNRHNLGPKWKISVGAQSGEHSISSLMVEFCRKQRSWWNSGKKGDPISSHAYFQSTCWILGRRQGERGRVDCNRSQEKEWNFLQSLERGKCNIGWCESLGPSFYLVQSLLIRQVEIPWTSMSLLKLVRGMGS